jgi:hypothetical protein
MAVSVFRRVNRPFGRLNWLPEAVAWRHWHRWGPVGAEHDAVRADFVDRKAQMPWVGPNHIEIDINVPHRDRHAGSVL